MDCRICNNRKNNESFIAKEMMLGMGDQFTYWECGDCGCLQIEEIPKNIDKYYPRTYYSFSDNVKTFSHTTKSKKWDWLKEFFQKELILYRLSNGIHPIGYLMSKLEKDYLRWMSPYLRINYNSKILDVGSGKGKLLLKLRNFGFKDLTGIDPFLSEDAINEKGLRVVKKDIFSVNEKFDLIMLHHSFEHMESPDRVFNKLSQIIKPDGVALIRIPVADSYAWRTYKTNWVELDAPRHYFLHTKKSMSILAENNGLQINHVLYDSYGSFEIVGSERYKRGLTFSDPTTIYSKEEKKQISRQVEKLNKDKQASRACFYLTKKQSIN